MSHYSKGKGAQKSSSFSCWASFPSHALFQLRHDERGRAQKYFMCVLFADPDWERVVLPPLRSALPASLAALPTSQSASWWLGAVHAKRAFNFRMFTSKGRFISGGSVERHLSRCLHLVRSHCRPLSLSISPLSLRSALE